MPNNALACEKDRAHGLAELNLQFIFRIDLGAIPSALIQLTLIVMMMHANNGAAREPRALLLAEAEMRGRAVITGAR